MSDALKEIEERLNRVIGLDVRSLGSSLIVLAVRIRMKKRGLASASDYVALLEAPGEWQAFLEEIVVPETWFFRDRQPFLTLADWVAQEWLPSHPYGVLRILSSPCSSGEEPYSIVMALLDAGVSPDRFSVEAVDISEAALAKARRGVYNRNSFRGPAQEYREKYFEKTAQGWQLAEAVRAQVQFRHVNVFDPAFARKEGHFDAIFCRNLLIYFAAAPRRRLMELLKEMLAADGRLFLGHAEGGIARSFGFEPLPFSMAFAFHKGSAARPAPKLAAVPKRAVPPLPVRKPPFPFPAVPAKRPAPAKAPAPPARESPESLLAKAQALADAGALDEARRQCEAALRLNELSARAYYLLGLICDADGRPGEAESFYRKTLYLMPDHYEALAQLALLAEKSGNGRAAAQLRQRAQRAQSKSFAHSTVS